jgi:serine/threonine protein kinase
MTAKEMIGKEIGIYRITERLGQGGMGVVFKAVDLNLDRVVALKLLNSEVDEMPELVSRFRAEARVQAGLSHPNLTTLYAFLVWEERPVMVMEFIEGETFQNMIARRGPIPANVTIPLFRQALLGVGAAHRRGIVHRDIKPANIMLNQQNVVKVMDFGIAKVLGVSGATRTNMQMGTSWYMSPEQIMTNAVDARSDIYSLGVTLYEMLAGQLPFDGDSDYAVQMAHLQKVPEPPTVYYPHIPAHVVAATMRSLAKRPEERFASVEDFLAALEAESFAGPVARPTPLPIPQPTPLPVSQLTPQPIPLPAPPPPIPPPPPPPVAAKQGVPKGLIAGGVAAAVLLVAGGIFYSNSVSRQHEIERERMVAQSREAENRRQAGIRQQREEEAKAEEQRTARELTERVKREQAESQTQAEAAAREKTAAAQRAAAQRAAAQRSAAAAAAVVPPQQKSVASPPQAQQPAAPSAANPYQKLNGMWRGTYICQQGQTAAQLLINANPQGVTAVMAFAVPNSQPGTFLMKGAFFPANSQINLNFVRWGNHPPNYTPANLMGTVDLNQGIISGRVLAAGCTTFVIRRQ